MGVSGQSSPFSHKQWENQNACETEEWGKKQEQAAQLRPAGAELTLRAERSASAACPPINASLCLCSRGAELFIGPAVCSRSGCGLIKMEEGKEKRAGEGKEARMKGDRESGFLSQQVAALAVVGTMADFLPPGGLVELLMVGRKHDLLSSRTS